VTRLSEKSMTRRPERYGAFCRDKIFVLDRYLERLGDNVVLDSVRRRAVAGVYAWAATSLYAIEGHSKLVHRYESKAAAHDPETPALALLDAWVAEAGETEHAAGTLDSPGSSRVQRGRVVRTRRR
jgi:hypothetical protein